MANSNENTQNPKDNQEKMTDEGIQKHSEHTAENKQPESKDDIQNKNKPTRLRDFFKKLWNGDAQEKNKNSKKVDKDATKNDDAAKQEEIKQADTVEQQKSKENHLIIWKPSANSSEYRQYQGYSSVDLLYMSIS